MGYEVVSGPGPRLSQCCSDSITPSFPSVCSGDPLFGLSCPPSGGKCSWCACAVSLDPHLHVPLPCPPSLRLAPPITAPSLLTQGWSEIPVGIFQCSWGQQASMSGSRVNLENLGHIGWKKVGADPTLDPVLASMW